MIISTASQELCRFVTYPKVLVACLRKGIYLRFSENLAALSLCTSEEGSFLEGDTPQLSAFKALLHPASHT